MPFAIVAKFPLDIYRGHIGDVTVDEIPSPARLHSALLAAAAAGLRSKFNDGNLMPNESDMKALEWLETNPPDYLALPELIVNQSEAVAYRNLGIIKQNKIRILDRPAAFSVSLNGDLAWVWAETPMAKIVESLVALCSDVTHLGMSETPVRLFAGDIDIDRTHTRDENADLFEGQGLDLEVPYAGRTKELIEQEKTLRQIQKNDKNEQLKSEEKENSGPPPRVCVGAARYIPDQPPELFHPWSQVLLLPLDRTIDPEWRVRWAVHAHRALIKLVRNEVPPILTGKYPDGAALPANRVAIHFLGQETLTEQPIYAKSTMAVLIPSGVSATDTEIINNALKQLQFLKGPGTRSVKVEGKLRIIDASRFWTKVPNGYVRRWLTDPAAVPDGRPPRHRDWSMADAISLSVGLVWRDILDPSKEKGNKWQIMLADKAKDYGVAVESLCMVTEGDLTRFVHKVNSGAVVRPYRALIKLGKLAGAQSLTAIGQSRHLGGGLLRPVDLPKDSLRAEL